MKYGFEKWGPDLTPEQQERLDFLLTGFVSIYHTMDAWLLMRVLREQKAEIARVRSVAVAGLEQAKLPLNNELYLLDVGIDPVAHNAAINAVISEIGVGNE